MKIKEMNICQIEIWKINFEVSTNKKLWNRK